MTIREKRLAEGLCTRCGKAPPKGSWQICEQCAQKQREAVKRVQDARRAAHRCVQCGGSLLDAEGRIPVRETEDGYRELVTCEKCRERGRKYDAKKRLEEKACREEAKDDG